MSLPLSPLSSTADNASSSFVPRKEFLHSGPKNPSSFSLLCLAGSNLLRLYEFPSSVITLFRRFLEQRRAIHSEKTDPHNNFTQFELEGKLWTSKSLSTERLLVEMLAIIYQGGYTYLSTIDFGRESDDRISIAFSRPCSPSEISAPFSSSTARIPYVTPIPDQPRPRVPFALSFPSATSLRVVCPPLHSTPAILQAVRSAWPRGVQSEKKIGENSFEFKLKGYRWFQEDTFATDSLRYILALLSSLDAQSFSLCASISLTNRARNKDLWIFTGPPPPLESPPPSILNASHSDINSHRRISTEPTGSSSHLPPSYHGRAATDVGRVSSQYLHGSGSSGSLPPSPGLRKAAPRAQVPVSVHDTDELPEPASYRADLPSAVPEGVEGAGISPDVFYSTSPFGDTSAVPLPLSPSANAPPASRGTPPLQQSHTSTLESTHEDMDVAPGTPEPHLEDELLSPGVFKDSGIYRDSAFSSNSEFSTDIPIKWTGAQRESQHLKQDRHISEGPKFPGGWEPTPVEEKEEDDVVTAGIDIHLDQTADNEQPMHDVRVASPEIIAPGNEIRKSEVGLVGLTDPSTPPPSLPTTPDPRGKEREGSGVGWVLVSIDGKNGEAPAPVSATSPSSEITTPPTALASNSTEIPAETTTSPSTKKTVVLVDNAEAKKGTKLKKDPSRLQRLLSITRRDPPKTVDESPVQEKRPRMRSLRSNRGRGTPEAKRNENGRRSFD
ncbi:hypothetical protein BDP27DRAFT_1327876 [Rhodocollybia butyracea]|uniref:Uncharacterized protein n=1 Tax=Rhodocollybia butyracea TaxID=206335 RepID=A0A9P5U7M3_9AGAR|nr:hypothetical protein BDP27DRAFT_1327876 [Rhodocollybia butyracea]